VKYIWTEPYVINAGRRPSNIDLTMASVIHKASHERIYLKVDENLLTVTLDRSFIPLLPHLIPI